jgi:phosphoglycolate phosphatase/putative hydrolase of the HAD superfamily
MEPVLQNLSNYKLIIFDVDGTLYHQPLLRAKMFVEMILYSITHPFAIKDIKIVRIYRKQREILALNGHDKIKDDQYKLCADQVKLSITYVKKTIDEWIRIRPLKYLSASKFKNIDIFLEKLKKAKVTTCVYSDYLADEKLKALCLKMDYSFSSEDEKINVLKPNPKGVLYILDKLNIAKKDALMIGDRETIDGACAKNAGIDYLIVKPQKANSIYKKLADGFESK